MVYWHSEQKITWKKFRFIICWSSGKYLLTNSRFLVCLVLRKISIKILSSTKCFYKYPCLLIFEKKYLFFKISVWWSWKKYFFKTTFVVLDTFCSAIFFWIVLQNNWKKSVLCGWPRTSFLSLWVISKISFKINLLDPIVIRMITFKKCTFLGRLIARIKIFPEQVYVS